MIHRLLLCLSACLCLVTNAHAVILPPQFDDSLPPATPSGDIDFPTQVPVGKTLLIPVAASNPNGGALIYSATSSNPSIMVRVRTGEPMLNLTVNHTAASGSDISVSGTLQLMLFREFTPTTTGFIAGMAQAGFYDGLTFHRILPEFMIQGGNGNGLPLFHFENEFKLPLIFTGKGQLAMANAGYDKKDGSGTNSSQFFITDSLPRYLDFNHTIFGQLVRGWDVLYNLSQVSTHDVQTSDTQIEKSGPDSPVTITSAKITKSNDAVLFLSASGTGSATITVSIGDVSAGSPVTTGTFNVTAVVDTNNDPVVLNPVPDAIAPANGKATVLLQAQDLEHDGISYGYTLLTSSTDYGSITSNSAGNLLQIGGKHQGFTGFLDVKVGAYQTNASDRGSSGSPWDFNTFYVGVGDKALTPQPVNLSLASGTTPQTIVAGSFLSKDPNAKVGSYADAQINWGDGTVSSGTTLITKAGSSAKFLVTGTHAYPNPGIYPLRAIVVSNLGATAKINGVVNVTAGSVFASGLTLASNGGVITKKQVASFVDQSPLPVASYQTVIDWGDGVSSSGTVVKLRGSTSFKVLGSHSYTDSADYPVNVSIVKNSETATAWSLAKVSKVNTPPFLPPFPVARLIPVLNFSGFTVTSGSSKYLALTGTMSVENRGNKTSAPSTLRFYLATLSNNLFTNASQIYYLNQESYALPAIKAGMKFNIPLTYSLNANGSIGKNTLLVLPVDLAAYPNAFPKDSTVIVYSVSGSDPIADLLPIPVYYYNLLNYTP